MALRIAGLTALVAWLFLLHDTAGAAPWPVTRAGQGTCGAQGPSVGGAEISILTLGPQQLLLVSSPGFSEETATYPVTLSFDDGHQKPFTALGHGRSYGIAITPELAGALRKSQRLTVTAGKESDTFAVEGAGQAIAAGRICADAVPAAPPAPVARAGGPQAISGAPDWKLIDRMPDADSCTVRRDGAEIDTMLVVNRNNTLLLVAGHRDWKASPAELKASISIDKGPALALQGHAMTNVVFIGITQEQTGQLLKATSVDWTLPWGTFHANVAGIDKAFDALTSCKGNRKSPAL